MGKNNPPIVLPRILDTGIGMIEVSHPNGSARIYYNDGTLWVNREIKAFDIILRGSYYLKSYNPNKFLMTINKNRVTGISLGGTINQSPFLEYKGYLVVVSGKILDINNNIYPVVPRKQYEDKFSKLFISLDSINEKFENLNRGDVKYNPEKFTRPIVQKKSKWELDNLHTSGGEFFLNGKTYIGDYHIHQDFTIMIGEKYTEKSEVLSFYIKDISAKQILKAKEKINYNNSKSRNGQIIPSSNSTNKGGY